MKKTNGFLSLLFVTISFVVVSCAPAPRHELTEEEKIADFYWIFSKFKENYAPLEYKAARYQFDFESLKNRYLEEAKKTSSNESFFLLMHQFVSEFHDAHTSSTLNQSDLPNRTQYAYLGFEAKRVGQIAVVTKLLPTIRPDSHFPIRVRDRISKINGVELTTFTENELFKYRDLGQKESNLTYWMPKIFARLSLAHPLPNEPSATLTLLRPHPKTGQEEEVEVTLPWIVKDLVTFSKEQRDASPKTESHTTALNESEIYDAALKVFTGELDLSKLLASVFPKAGTISNLATLLRSFRFEDISPTVGSKRVRELLSQALEKPILASDELQEERIVPSHALFVTEAKTYPAYVTRENVLDKDGRLTGEKAMVGYIYLNTFSPSSPDEFVLEEVKKTLQVFLSVGAEKVVIDLLNNGGGSLTLGVKLAQLFSGKLLKLPLIQMRANETWVDNFEAESLQASSDANRELARRMYEELLRVQKTRTRLTAPHAVDELMPFEVQANADLRDRTLNIVLMTNEMCASMCDIFTQMLKENGLAKSVGAQTMGAGGNVTNHMEAPNSHLVLRQTESLLVKADGTYLENNGIEPDLAMTVHTSVMSKYEPVRLKAIEMLVKKLE